MSAADPSLYTAGLARARREIYRGQVSVPTATCLLALLSALDLAADLAAGLDGVDVARRLVSEVEQLGTADLDGEQDQ
jgi:hypothetical protein